MALLDGILDHEVSLLLAVVNSGLASLSDFNSSTLSYMFAPGSSPGDEVCEHVSIYVDGVVEDEEDFSVMLLANPEEEDIHVVEGNATVFINDSLTDSKSYIQLAPLWGIL